jgi:hypothetical protein
VDNPQVNLALLVLSGEIERWSESSPQWTVSAMASVKDRAYRHIVGTYEYIKWVAEFIADLLLLAPALE